MNGRRLAPARHAPSPTRQSDGPIRVFALNAGPLRFAPPQPAGWSHLVSVRSGAASVRSAGALALVVPGRALWVPAGTEYAIDLHGPCDLRIAYVATWFGVERAYGSVAMPALLVEILERAVISGYLDPDEPRDARLIAVAGDELRALCEIAGVALRMPREAPLLAVAERALLALEERPTIAALAAAAAMSLRTFERHFANETGLAPRAWLRRARLVAATVALARGASVTEAGLASGYASLSAFVAAYRSVFLTTPGSAARTARALTR